MKKILISSCLAGEKVRYNGSDRKINHPLINKWDKEGRLILACPEILGGLSTPRPSAEIINGSGLDALNKHSKITDINHNDLTKEFIDGAEKTLEIIKEHNIDIAIMAERSPSCGSCKIYDGTFSGKLIHGEGVTTALLRKNGVTIYNENQLDDIKE
ncbi:MAG: DUF523 domain-containing protein [Hyphomicrobiales bacterium]